MKAQWIIVCGLGLALLTAIVAVFNTDPVTLSYGAGEVQVSLIIVIAAAVLLGGLIVALFGTTRPYRLHKEIESLKHENEALREESNTLHTKAETLRAEKADLLEKLARAEAHSEMETYEDIHAETDIHGELSPRNSVNGQSSSPSYQEDEERNKLRHRMPGE